MVTLATHKRIIVAVIVLTFTIGIFLFLYPPSLFPDPSHGFQVMWSMQMGGGFNLMISPDKDDIAKNTAEYLTWWSPGNIWCPIFSLRFFMPIRATPLF